MVKYRRLTQKELTELEQDFVKFLSAQSITANDWINIKQKDEPRTHELIDQFSDIVLDKALSNISYLEMLNKKEIKIFKFEERKARLLGLRIGSTDLDIRNEKELKQLFKSAEELKKHQVEVFELEKMYTKTRAEEVFFLVKNGALIADNTLYELIDSLVSKS